MTGKVVRIVKDKGFFFIKPDDGSDDHFAHMSALKNIEFAAIREGDRVDFRPDRNPKGPRAEHIYYMDGDNVPNRPETEFEGLFEE